MLSYHDALHTDLSTLTTAAEKWEKAAGMFKDAAKIYDKQVKGIFEDGSASGRHAQAGLLATGTTSGQYTGAQQEAKAIASLLRDAHHQFTELRKNLESEIADAKKAKMKVSEDKGVCSWDWDRIDADTKRAIVHDPSSHESEEYWTKRIAKVVKDMDEADHGVKLALDAVTVDSAPLDGIKNGFNAKAEGDIEKVEGKRASELATKLNSDGKLPPREMAELARLNRDNAHDKAYSQTMLNSLGTYNTIKLVNSLNNAAQLKDTDHKKGYLALEKGLATTLATATKDTDSAFYKKWREDMKKTGVKRFEDTGVVGRLDKYRGYQSLLTLMEQGDPKDYSPQMLKDLGHDLRAAEDPKKGGDPGIWDTHGTFSGKNDGWFANDPLDATLGIMSHQPDTATEFLDPGPHDKNDMLKYLLDDRDWEISDETKQVGIADHTSPLEDKDNRVGLGAALQAAATGHVPGTEHVLGGHSTEQARIMHDMITTLNETGQAEKMPAALRAPIGQALKDYTPDTHEILARVNTTYSDRALDPHKADIWGPDNNAKMSVTEEQLIKVMRGVADDHKTFGEMYDAERQYNAVAFADMPKSNTSPETLNPIQKASTALGMYDGVRADVTFDIRDGDIQKARDVNHDLTASSGVVLNFMGDYVPAGDVANRVVDFVAYDATKDKIAEATADSTHKNSHEFMFGQQTVDDMVVSWAGSHGEKPDSDFTETLVGHHQTKYREGREDALDYLRPAH
ncbi:hypothetical protein [Streptomyces ochraceiscleroticus]|uniref:AG2 protein n=1 Tax=Streptomyces ochraceiscleroticus TaxID=47761 RepID=A0ABW1MCT6_9ACTN|nr:hypothetical protein [Streptomyces ochraceiscleroticus]